MGKVSSREKCKEKQSKERKKETKKQRKKFGWLVGWFVGFYDISTFVGYLTPNPFYVNNQFYLKQFSLA